jgi:bifunctional non-homologous end joining protein LigD
VPQCGCNLTTFGLLHLDAKDLRGQTLYERRAQLERLVVVDAESRIQFSEQFDGDGKTLFDACAERGLQGIISKHSMSRKPNTLSPDSAQYNKSHACCLDLSLQQF